MATVNIFVSLDVTANPPVVLTNRNGVSERSKDVEAGDTIKWRRLDRNDQFDITELNPTGATEAFATATTGGNGQRLESNFQPGSTVPPDQASYEYTLTVTLDGTPYTTTGTIAADDDKPVIRNNQ